MLHDYAQRQTSRRNFSLVKISLLVLLCTVTYYYYDNLLLLNKHLPSNLRLYNTDFKNIQYFLTPPVSAPSVHIVHTPSHTKAASHLHRGYSLESTCLSQQRAQSLHKDLATSGYITTIRPDAKVKKDSCSRLVYSAANDAATLAKVRRLLSKRAISSTTYIAR